MSGMQIRAWRPLGANKTVTLAITAASQTMVIPDTPLGTRALRIVNAGTQVVFIDFVNSGSTGTASLTTSVPILANTVEVFTIGFDVGSLVAIAAATGSTLSITYGEGL